MKVLQLHLISLMLLAAGSGQFVAAQEDFSKVYEKANQAVVLIDFEDGAREVGSGVVVGVTKSGAVLILTANHVVEGYEEVYVSFAGDVEQHRSGTVSETLFSEAEDMAMVVVQDPPSGVEVISLRESPGKKGESVGTIGHPLGEAFTWSNGSISNIHGKYIVHDARLKRGSSGGPLLDDCSRLLGMNVHIIEVPEDDSGQSTDIPEGTSIALAASSIASLLDGWFADTRFEEKWSYKKYCSFWERLYKQPVILVGEAILAAGGIYLLVTSGDDGNGPVEATFGEPPDPPNGR